MGNGWGREGEKEGAESVALEATQRDGQTRWQVAKYLAAWVHASSQPLPSPPITFSPLPACCTPLHLHPPLNQTLCVFVKCSKWVEEGDFSAVSNLRSESSFRILVYKIYCYVLLESVETNSVLVSVFQACEAWVYFGNQIWLVKK